MPNEAPSLTKATYDKKRIVEFEPGQPCPVATSAGATPRQKKSRPKATYQFQNARHADERQSPKKRRRLGQISENKFAATPRIQWPVLRADIVFACLKQHPSKRRLTML